MVSASFFYLLTINTSMPDYYKLEDSDSLKKPAWKNFRAGFFKKITICLPFLKSLNPAKKFYFYFIYTIFDKVLSSSYCLARTENRFNQLPKNYLNGQNNSKSGRS